jgi:broad specificity phosphatase PhoE
VSIRKGALIGITFILLNWGIGFVLIQSYRALPSIPAASSNSFPPTEDQEYWANEVLNGGYILYFRHAEREKWNTVTVFDWLEVEKGLDGRNESFSSAICLTEKGIEEAKVLGKIFNELQVDVSKVVASPSCRAQETAEYAFGKVDQTWLSALHATAVNAEQREKFAPILKGLLEDNAPQDKENVVVIAHGNTLNYYENEIFLDVEFAEWQIDELGFYVLESTPDGLIARYAFVNFSDFANTVLSYS